MNASEKMPKWFVDDPLDKELLHYIGEFPADVQEHDDKDFNEACSGAWRWPPEGNDNWTVYRCDEKFSAS